MFLMFYFSCEVLHAAVAGVPAECCWLLYCCCCHPLWVNGVNAVGWPPCMLLPASLLLQSFLLLLAPLTLIKKKTKFFSCIRKFRWDRLQSHTVYCMRKGFLIYEEMRKYLTIYEEAVSHTCLWNRSLLNFLTYDYEENFLFFFTVLSVLLLLSYLLLLVFLLLWAVILLLSTLLLLVAGVPTAACVTAIACIPAVAGFPAVAYITAIACIPALAGVPLVLMFSLLLHCTVHKCRKTKSVEIRCTYGIINGDISQKKENISHSDDS
jgi:hypothetical protein